MPVYNLPKIDWLVYTILLLALIANGYFLGIQLMESASHMAFIMTATKHMVGDARFTDQRRMLRPVP